jgi:hypothetical protein
MSHPKAEALPTPLPWYPRSSQIGVHFSGVHPNRAPSTRGFRVDGQKSSQIGVHFRDHTPFGVG